MGRRGQEAEAEAPYLGHLRRQRGEDCSHRSDFAVMPRRFADREHVGATWNRSYQVKDNHRFVDVAGVAVAGDTVHRKIVDYSRHMGRGLVQRRRCCSSAAKGHRYKQIAEDMARYRGRYDA